MEERTVLPNEFRERQRLAREAARARGLAGLVVWSRGGTTVDFYGDVFYLTGHHSPFPANQDTAHWSGRSYSALVLPVEGDPVLVVDIPNYDRANVFVEDVRWTLRVPETTGRAMKETGLAREEIGLVGRDTLLVRSYQLIEAEVGHPVRYEPADDILENLRRRKSEAEIGLIRHAAEVGVEWMSTMMRGVEAGRTEGEIVGEGLRYLAAHGGYPYDVAVTSGPNSAHFERIGIPSWDWQRKIEDGDLLHIDAWGPVDKYFTDFVRSTVVGGEPSSEQREVLEGAISVVDHIIAGIKPGVRVGELYERGATAVRDLGFVARSTKRNEEGTYFGDLFPAFGHGIGLGLEPPWIVEGEDTVLEPNVVLAVEVLVGREGVGGAGFEDNVIVSEDGAENLTSGCPARWWD